MELELGRLVQRSLQSIRMPRHNQKKLKRFTPTEEQQN